MRVEELKNKLTKIVEKQIEIFRDVCHTSKYNYLALHSENLTYEEKELKNLCVECVLKRNRIWIGLETLADTTIYNSNKENINSEMRDLEIILNKINELKKKINWN